MSGSQKISSLILLMLTSLLIHYTSISSSSFFLVEALIIDAHTPRLSQHPHLEEFVQAQTNTLLSLNLDIHHQSSKIQHAAPLPITKIQVGLHCQQLIPSSSDTIPPMPGFDGPLPELSSGVFGMDIPYSGEFVALQEGCNTSKSITLSGKCAGPRPHPLDPSSCASKSEKRQPEIRRRTALRFLNILVST